MKSIINVQKRLIPDLVEIMQKRYRILRYIEIMQPVGRRSLSQSLQITERVLRSETDFLKDQDLITISMSGMRLTEEGKIILDQLEPIMKEFSSAPELEKQLAAALNLQSCNVVSGNADESDWVKSELGRACVSRLKEVIKEGQVISVTGGSTMNAVAEAFTEKLNKENLLFVPARGGIGADIKDQANTICQKMANKAGGNYTVLYSPDQVTKELYETFIQESSIREVLMKIKSADIVIHGIGDAMTMARRRMTSEEDMQKLVQEKAVAEAFGYYFDENGRIVHKVQTVGLQLEDLKNIPHIFAVAGGASKAKAIKAYMKIAPKNTVLITDEAVTNEILKG
ncbi:sugar-binding transcriptional regulator [Caldibacillus thermoamylovorans]|uniref:sugar-binding transcriptional regulator n=1 Tax=Caldibacillus thermoamylovorans TaxID=35841 RepID=UPI001D087E1D|nr:sugar-binding domain-containing protein [Caldibacillus thermoamylovorans]MCB5935039.1 sugar-binding transcriptional regulator [Bacillus sp. DFI.2.34]MCB7076028.1 sugar-binding transcriptional regulator [Caldibacillus thermoamylovorans]